MACVVVLPAKTCGCSHLSVCSSSEVNSLRIRRADDLHVHLRDGEDRLRVLVPHCCKQFARATVMPNLIPPVRSAADAVAYRKRIMRHVPSGVSFTPLMTLYLTDSTTAEMITAAKSSGVIYACKLYPKGATTNSDSGVTDIGKVRGALLRMAELKMPLLIHGEVTDDSVDLFGRESAFLTRVLPKILAITSKLRVVLEHVSTAEAVAIVKADWSGRLAATITAHHLMATRSDILAGGLKPHFYCLPVLKKETDRKALVRAALSGDTRFFAGTDSAPHCRAHKECCKGKAGVYTGACALQLYAQVFADGNALHKLEAFTSQNGARFYGLPLNEGYTTLVRKPYTIPESFDFLTDFEDGFQKGGSKLVPFKAGQTLDWSIAE